VYSLSVFPSKYFFSGTLILAATQEEEDST